MDLASHQGGGGMLLVATECYQNRSDEPHGSFDRVERTQDFTFFTSSCDLCGVDKFYRGLPPIQITCVHSWLAYWTLTGESSWSLFKFLISPL